MPAEYDKMGIHFLYPENWTLDEADALEGETSVSVYSPEGAFWSVLLHPRDADPKKLAQAALLAMKQEYEDLEAEPITETVGGQAMSGFDMNFYCLDLTNSACIRGFRTEDFTYLLLCQAEDREFKQIKPVFRAITTSLLEGS